MNPTAFIPPEPDSASKPSLVCGGASIVLPLLGGVLGYAIVVGKPGGDAGWPNVILGPLVLPASSFGVETIETAERNREGRRGIPARRP